MTSSGRPDPGRGPSAGRRYLVTGAQGFTGRYLVAHLLAGERRARVVGLGRSPRREGTFTHRIERDGRRVRAPLPPPLREAQRDHRYRYERVDVGDRAAMVELLREVRPDVVFHLAAKLRDEDPGSLIDINVRGTASLVEAIAESGGSPRLVLASSGAVYGAVGVDELPCREEGTPCRPVEIYAATKLAAEHVARVLARRAGCPLICARLFQLVGAGQDERHVCGRFGRLVAAAARSSRPTVLATGALHTTRDFVDVRDVAAALAVLGRRGRPGSVYNVARGREASVRRVLDELLEIAAPAAPVTVEEGPGRDVDMPRLVASVARLEALGFRAAFSLRDSLSAVLRYYLEVVPAAESAAS